MSPILTALVFAAVASPKTYQLTRSIGGDWIATSDGTAKMGGLFLHALVFTLLLHFLWKMMSKKSGYGPSLRPAKSGFMAGELGKKAY